MTSGCDVPAALPADVPAAGPHPDAEGVGLSASWDRRGRREQIVAGLVCEGLTNQQVAHRLVLSVKTVGYHLGNVYTKLDVHSRTQLVARLSESR